MFKWQCSFQVCFMLSLRFVIAKFRYTCTQENVSEYKVGEWIHNPQHDPKPQPIYFGVFCRLLCLTTKHRRAGGIWRNTSLRSSTAFRAFVAIFLMVFKGRYDSTNLVPVTNELSAPSSSISFNTFSNTSSHACSSKTPPACMPVSSL